MDLIGVLFIIWIVFRIKKAAQMKGQETKPNQPRQNSGGGNLMEQMVRQKMPTMPNQNSGWSGSIPNAHVGRSNPVPNEHKGRRDPVPNQPAGGSLEERKKQAELKKRLQQKHGTANNSSYNRPKTTGSAQNTSYYDTTASRIDLHEDEDILAMANEQVDQQHKDDQARIHKEREDNKNAEDYGYAMGMSVSMKKVQSLMITGYSGDLNFKRDFVAEGVEMMNRFTDTKYIEK